MRIVDMPGCCTAKVLVHFGQERNSVYGMDGEENVNQKELNRLLTYYKRYGIAYIIATLTENQTKGIQLLKDNGFEHTEFIEKPRHEDSKVAVFTLNLRKWEPKEEGETKERWYTHRGGSAYLSRIKPGERIVVRFRGGGTSRGTVGSFNWKWYGDIGDIVSYRKQGGQD